MHTRPGVCAHHLPKELHFPKKGARRQAFPNPNTNTAAHTRAHPKSWNEGAILALCKCQARKWTRTPPQIKRQVCLYSLHPGKTNHFVSKASLEIYACMRLWSLHLNFYKGVQVGSGKKTTTRKTLQSLSLQQHMHQCSSLEHLCGSKCNFCIYNVAGQFPSTKSLFFNAANAHLNISAVSCAMLNCTSPLYLQIKHKVHFIALFMWVECKF